MFAQPGSVVYHRSVLRIEGVEKAYEEVAVLRGIDLAVQGGEVVGLLGANGSGKTTLNRITSGLLAPEAGSVTIGGVSLTADPEGAMRNLGYLPERPHLYPDLSIGETLELVCDLRGVPEASAWIERTLRVLDLGEVSDRLVRALSQGMTRKLSLAVALAGDPAVLLFDEPTNGLDPPAVVLFKQVLEELRRRERAILLSSHMLALLEPLCDRVAILEAGRIQACGSLAELREVAGLGEVDLETLYLHFTGRERGEVAELFAPLS